MERTIQDPRASNEYDDQEQECAPMTLFPRPPNYTSTSTTGETWWRPPQQVHVEEDINHDDMASVMTDLQTIEYEVGRGKIFPSIAEVQEMQDDEEAHVLPVLPSSSVSRASMSASAITSKLSPNQANAAVTKEKISFMRGPESAAGLKETPQDGGTGQAVAYASKNNTCEGAGDEATKGSTKASASNQTSNHETESVAPSTAPTVQYDNRGRVAKSSADKGPHNKSEAKVGAFPQAGPAPLEITSVNDDVPQDEHRNCVGNEDVVQTARVEIDPKKEDSPPGRFQKRTYIVCAVVVSVLLIGVIVISVVLLTGDSPEEGLLEAQGENEENTDIPQGLDLTLVPGLTKSTISALDDVISPQRLAYEWVAKDPNWDSFEDWRKQQRYALACARYVFLETSSLFLYYMRYHTSECNWQSQSRPLCPNDDGIVRNLGTATFSKGYGHLPPEIAFLSHLEIIDMTKWGVVPTIEALLPLEVAPNAFPALKDLVLHDCELSGSIPSTLGLLTSLTRLDLSKNILDSTIPTELGLLSNLTTLVLSNNRLSGTIPEEIGNLPFLTIMEAEDIPLLEPSLPSGLCSAERLAFDSLVTDWCADPNSCCGN